MTKKKKHIGSSFDDFLEEEDMLVDANAEAIKKVLAWQIAQKDASPPRIETRGKK